MIFYHEGDDIIARISQVPGTDNTFNCITRMQSGSLEYDTCGQRALDRLQPMPAAWVKALFPDYFQEVFHSCTKEIAAKFSEILHEWDDGTRPINMQEVVARNKVYAAAENDSCASHEMVDANQAMIDAFEALGIELIFPSDIEGYPLELQGAITAECNIQVDLTNAAWDLAKRLEFDVARIIAHK
jgi:hypothetical protein